MGEYRTFFYRDSRTGKSSVEEYVHAQDKKITSKILKYIEYLRERDGYLDEPYSKHIHGSIRELRVDFAKQRHRIFFFTFIGRRIIFLHAFEKKSAKTPIKEIEKAQEHYQDVITHSQLYA